MVPRRIARISRALTTGLLLAGCQHAAPAGVAVPAVYVAPAARTAETGAATPDIPVAPAGRRPAKLPPALAIPADPAAAIDPLARSRATHAAWNGYHATIRTFSRWERRTIGNRLDVAGPLEGPTRIQVLDTNLAHAQGATLAYDGGQGLRVDAGLLVHETVDLADPAWLAWAPLLPLITWPGILAALARPDGSIEPAGDRVLAGARLVAFRHRSPQLSAAQTTEWVAFDPDSFAPRLVQREDAAGIAIQIVFESIERYRP